MFISSTCSPLLTDPLRWPRNCSGKWGNSHVINVRCTDSTPCFPKGRGTMCLTNRDRPLSRDFRYGVLRKCPANRRPRRDQYDLLYCRREFGNPHSRLRIPCVGHHYKVWPRGDYSRRFRPWPPQFEGLFHTRARLHLSYAAALLRPSLKHIKWSPHELCTALPVTQLRRSPSTLSIMTRSATQSIHTTSSTTNPRHPRPRNGSTCMIPPPTILSHASHNPPTRSFARLSPVPRRPFLAGGLQVSYSVNSTCFVSWRSSGRTGTVLLRALRSSRARLWLTLEEMCSEDCKLPRRRVG